MNRFGKMGFIDHNGSLQVNGGLLTSSTNKSTAFANDHTQEVC